MINSIDTLLAEAYRNLDRIDGSLDTIQSIVDRHQVVAAIWPDIKAQDGVGVRVIKGLRLCGEVVAINQSRPDILVTAIPCADVGEADRMAALFGEPDRMH